MSVCLSAVSLSVGLSLGLSVCLSIFFCLCLSFLFVCLPQSVRLSCVFGVAALVKTGRKSSLCSVSVCNMAVSKVGALFYNMATCIGKAPEWCW